MTINYVAIGYQECVVYLCGTKYDLVEENKKVRKIEAGVVRDYLDGECVISAVCVCVCVCGVCVCVCVCVELVCTLTCT